MYKYVCRKHCQIVLRGDSKSHNSHAVHGGKYTTSNQCSVD